VGSTRLGTTSDASRFLNTYAHGKSHTAW
jgi:hypothetical protein